MSGYLDYSGRNNMLSGGVRSSPGAAGRGSSRFPVW